MTNSTRPRMPGIYWAASRHAMEKYDLMVVVREEDLGLNIDSIFQIHDDLTINLYHHTQIEIIKWGDRIDQPTIEWEGD